VAERGQEDTLHLLQATRAGQQRLKPVLVLLNRARASAFGELKEGCGSKRRTKAQVKEVLEPSRGVPSSS
jgi:hypothetical protein